MNHVLTKQELSQRALRFFNRYGNEVDMVRQLLEVRLDQLALAYRLQNGLPKEAVQVYSRCKSLQSFLKKLDRKGWPQYYYLTEIATDLIGAKIVCWFLDDCYGMFNYIKDSEHINIQDDSIKDYINSPKASGYRSIHLLTNMEYDRVERKDSESKLISDHFVCEIQIRTKLQEAWAEFTHEMHYKLPEAIPDEYNTLVATMADRLHAEDTSAMALREILKVDPEADGHEGLRPEED